MRELYLIILIIIAILVSACQSSQAANIPDKVETQNAEITIQPTIDSSPTHIGTVTPAIEPTAKVIVTKKSTEIPSPTIKPTEKTTDTPTFTPTITEKPTPKPIEKLQETYTPKPTEKPTAQPTVTLTPISAHNCTTSY